MHVDAADRGRGACTPTYRKCDDQCRRFEVPAVPAANSSGNFKSKSGTGNHKLAGAPLLPKFVLEGAAMHDELRKGGTSAASAAELRSGKGHHDENFPVASWLIAPRHRAPILAFYEFVRVADDIADHPSLPAPEKLALLDRLEDGLLGRGEAEPVAER